ncbi:phosphonate C-P lyase system protein PhnH [Halomonas sp. MCCC 1A11036]|uniref:Phosphonate C-P lyase system protein PhnH n=1 Tax=Billgrantia zhangzhouensis TaxID=2733481 RepID=A0ABS9AIW5_9GAMM|nr:phosphonate C-P lyase system protein PhnH [Halomonas zhangzhouensis]MCE8021710.1 phosphonate C-P lyase system protein PhnH [Halomonas zhangzhouensis]
MPWPTLNDPVHDSQRMFRQLLAAMSEPGTLHTLAAPAPPQDVIGPALWGALLTLCDLDVRVLLAPALDTPALREALVFHTGCCLTDEPGSADFALMTPATLCEAPEFALGSDEYPERSTTLLVALEFLDSGDTGSGTWRLSGPGIPAQRTLRMEERARPLMLRLAANRQGFPCGLDAILGCGERLAALPRTTRIEEVV